MTTRRNQTPLVEVPRPALPAVHSNESGRSYQLDQLIGKGGFGEIYLATPLPARGLPLRVCVKISYSIAGWLREAYFAQPMRST
ncbi:MAG: hypothetical protein ABI836_08930 [Gemmatimonadota bacterium]